MANIKQKAKEMFDKKFFTADDNDIKSFIDQIIDLTIAERNKEIVDGVKNKICSFANVQDYKEAVKSIAHLMFRKPNCNAEEYLFLGKAQSMQDIINLITSTNK